MRAIFDQNNLDSGFARITLYRDDSDTAFYTDGDSIGLGKYTGSTRDYMPRIGGKKWIGAPEALKLAVRPEVGTDSVSFILQPAYVDNMEDGAYSVCLLSPNGQEKLECNMSAYDIMWSDMGETSTLKDYRDDNPVDPVSDPDPQPVPPNAPEPSTQPTKPQESATESSVLPESKKGGHTTKLIVAIIALVVLVGGGFLYMNHRANQQAIEQARIEAEQKAAEEARLEAERKAAEEAARLEAERKAAEEAARKADARGRVAAFFAGERNPEAAIQLASDLDANTIEQQDALFRLYYYAASQGHQEGCLRYAMCVDPSLQPWGTISKDGAESWYYYGKAGNAEEARQQLKKWAEDRAAAGDTTAAGWLKEMK